MDSDIKKDIIIAIAILGILTFLFSFCFNSTYEPNYIASQNDTGDGGGTQYAGDDSEIIVPGGDDDMVNTDEDRIQVPEYMESPATGDRFYGWHKFVYEFFEYIEGVLWRLNFL